MSNTFLAELEERFLRYVQIDTTADPTSSTSPSSAIQFDLLNLLADELKEIGAQEVTLTELGVPTPNVFTGMQEIHGPLEWVSLQDMAAATEVCIKLVQLWAAAGPGDAKAERSPESPADTGAAVDWTDAI